MGVNFIIEQGETSLRSVRAALDAGRLKVVSRRPTRVGLESANAFIAACREAKLVEVRAVASDLLDQNYARPWEIAARFGVDETQVLGAIQRGRLPCVARGLWLFVSPNDAEAFAVAHQKRRAAA